MSHILSGFRADTSGPLQHNTQNYEAKYPPDASGDELGDDARIWRVYNDEAREYDRDMVQRWREMIDILLVFAGLFSAALTTLIAQATALLEPDYNKASTILLAQLVLDRRGQNVSTTNAALETDHLINTILLDSFVPSTIHHWTCGLWFASLTLSLITSLACVVVKQWLSGYLSSVSASPRLGATIRQFRFMGLDAWKVPFIIGLLPQALTLSLFLFLGGLVTYLLPYSRPIALTVAAITIMSVSLYLLSSTISALDPTCPYRTPLSNAIRFCLISFHNFVLQLFNQFTGRKSPPDGGFHHTAAMPVYIKALEVQVASSDEGQAKLGMQSLFWLHNAAQNPVVIRLVVESLSALVSVPEIGFGSKMSHKWVEAFQTVRAQRMNNGKRTSWLHEIRRALISRIWRQEPLWRSGNQHAQHRVLRASRLVFANDLDRHRSVRHIDSRLLELLKRQQKNQTTDEAEGDVSELESPTSRAHPRTGEDIV